MNPMNINHFSPQISLQYIFQQLIHHFFGYVSKNLGGLIDDLQWNFLGDIFWQLLDSVDPFGGLAKA